MKKCLNLLTAILASLKPKSKLPIIDCYGQSTLNQDEQQALMEWLFACLMGAGYFSKAHLIWDDGQDREPEIFSALMRNEPNSCTPKERDLHQRLKDMAGGPLANIRVCGCISWRWKLKESEGDPVILEPAKTFT